MSEKKPKTFSREIEVNGRRMRVQLADLSSIFSYDDTPSLPQSRQQTKE